MKLLDSNIIIYSYQSSFSFLKPLVVDPENGVSAISRLEILGFHAIQPSEQTYCEYVFQVLQQFPVDNLVLDEAIGLRKLFKMKLGDSIVAATALVYQAELLTRNIDDFKNIPGLVVINPIP
jgi:toxin FitB